MQTLRLLLDSKWRRNIKKTKEISEKIYKNIAIHADSYVARAEMAGPYINFFMSRTFLNETVLRVLLDRENFGNLDNKGKIILEHTSANPDGPLHIAI